MIIYRWPEVELNHRHTDFQSVALPTELSGHGQGIVQKPLFDIGDYLEKQVNSSFSNDKLDGVPDPSTSKRQSELLHPESYFQKPQPP